MTYSELVTKINNLSVAIGTYSQQFEHGYIVGLNDGQKTYPLCLLQPAKSNWTKLGSNCRKEYNIELYLFTLSDGKTHAERDAIWVLQENALDTIIAGLIADSEMVLFSHPTYERYEDEQGALFNQRVAWLECRFNLILVE